MMLWLESRTVAVVLGNRWFFLLLFFFARPFLAFLSIVDSNLREEY